MRLCKDKILLVGDDTFEIYVKAFYKAFCELGYENVRLFSTNRYMDVDENGQISSLGKRMQNKIALGPMVNKVNRKLLQEVEKYKPQLVFLYSTRIIHANIVRRIRKNGAKVFVYNNDNPFADYYPRYFWRHYRKMLKYADVGFAYRQSNVSDYQKVGCPKVEMLRSYYMDKRNYYMEKTKETAPKVVFIGHKEADGRYEYIRAALEAGIEIGVPELNWRGFEEGNPRLIRLKNCMEKYNEQMNASLISIVFLSTINGDSYTRRCFEIPATKRMMFSVYTDDIASMFEEDKEIVFFRTKEEFVKKIKYYLVHEDECRKIGEAGYQRLMKDGHEVKDRVKQIMKVYSRL